MSLTSRCVHSRLENLAIRGGRHSRSTGTPAVVSATGTSSQAGAHVNPSSARQRCGADFTVQRNRRSSAVPCDIRSVFDRPRRPIRMHSTASPSTGDHSATRRLRALSAADATVAPVRSVNSYAVLAARQSGCVVQRWSSRARAYPSISSTIVVPLARADQSVSATPSSRRTGIAFGMRPRADRLRVGVRESGSGSL